MAIEDSTDFPGAIVTPPPILWQIGQVMRSHPLNDLRLKYAIISFLSPV
ncbi:hypothetical protein [Oscillatoria sp. HE19RPO]|nr:hypothetical protein [Oscillatoria sp. HE19RPO]